MTRRRTLRSLATLSNFTGAIFALTSLLGCATAIDDDRAPEPVDTYLGALTSPLSAADILGFETTAGWTAQSGTKALSTDRTQSASALAWSGLSGYVTLTSAALSSQALPNLGTGSQLSIDVNLPTQQQNPHWHGAIQLFVSVPSKNVNNAYLGQVELTPLPKGRYTTLHFTLPDATAAILQGATYSDLKFTVTLNVPQDSPGTYRLDNLRVRGAFPRGGAEDAQPGESILMRAWKGNGTEPNRIEDLTLPNAIIQIPQSFHVTEGNAGSGALYFEYAATANGTLQRCTYTGNSATSGQTYELSSCASGLGAGELTLASRVKLTVASGDGTGARTKVRAQIAKNPLGDEFGNIAPIPTYFGKSTAEYVAIVGAYIEAQKTWPIARAHVVHVPTPEFEFNPVVVNNLATLVPVPPPGSLDPPFRQDGSATGTDIIDARYSVDGFIDVQMTDPTVRTALANTDVELRAVVLGFEASLAHFSAEATSTARKFPDGSSEVTSTFELCTEYATVDMGCIDEEDNQTFPQTLFDYETSFNIVTIPWLVFQLSADAHIEADLVADLEFPENGIGLSLTPRAKAQLVVEGGVGLGVVGGGLSGAVDLINLEVPSTLAVSSFVDTAPRACEIKPSFVFNTKAIVKAGGGAVSYYYEGGVTCGFWAGLCWRDEGELFSWNGLEQTFDLVTAVPIDSILPQPLPPENCPTGISLTITNPDPNQTFLPGQTAWISYEMTRPGPGNTIEEVVCSAGSATSPGDVIDPPVGQQGTCAQRITFGTADGPRTISVQATDDIGSAPPQTVNVSVSAPPPDSPPVPSIEADTVLTNCFNPMATLVAHYLYESPNPVELTWYVDGEFRATGPTVDVGSGLVRLVVSDTVVEGMQGEAFIRIRYQSCPH